MNGWEIHPKSHTQSTKARRQADFLNFVCTVTHGYYKNK
jgi:hypothetical protein